MDLSQREFIAFDGSSKTLFYRDEGGLIDINTLSCIWGGEYFTQDITYSPGDTFIDIGSYIGGWASLMETLVPDARVIAVEPVPENAEIIRKNINGTVLNLAVHRNSGDTLPLNKGEGAYLFMSGVYREDCPGEVIQIQTIGLDDLLADVERCRVLKTDCEAAEFPLFEGASIETLQKIDYIVGEFHLGADEEKVLELTKGLFTIVKSAQPSFLLKNISIKE